MFPNQLGAGEPDSTVEGASAAHHDHFVLQPGGIGELPIIFIVAASHACRRCRRHRSGRPG